MRIDMTGSSPMNLPKIIYDVLQHLTKEELILLNMSSQCALAIGNMVATEKMGKQFEMITTAGTGALFTACENLPPGTTDQMNAAVRKFAEIVNNHPLRKEPEQEAKSSDKIPDISDWKL